MNNTETLAISFLKGKLAESKIISPTYINEGDKEPIWDGYILVYDAENRKNENLKGKIPVQVKGRMVKKIKKEYERFVVNLIDLRNYLKEGGTIFFLVTINSIYEKKIYYYNLLPFEIQGLIKKMKNNEITISLKEFPIIAKEFECVFINYLEDKEKQKNIDVVFDLKNINNFNIKNLHIAYNVPEADFLKYNISEFCKKNDIFLYYQENNVYYTIGKIIEAIFDDEMIVREEVIINKVKFYDSFKLINEKNKTTFYIGAGTSIELVKSSDIKPKIEFVYKGTLNERILDTTFLIELLKHQLFYLGKFEFPVKLSDNFVNEKIIEFNEILTKYLEVKKFLNENNVYKDLSFKELSNDEINYIFGFVERFFKKEVKLFDDKEDIRYFIPKFGNIKILFICLKNEKGLYEIKNFFKNDFQLIAEINKGFIEYSHMLLLKKEDILTYDNIDYNFIFENIISKAKNERYFELVNLFILELLLAYDEKNGSDKDLLILCKKLVQWLIDNNEWSKFDHVFEINFIQILKRKNSLDDDKRLTLNQIVINNPKNYQVLIACYILLDETSSANYYFHKLSKTDQEKFKAYPIYNLCNVLAT